MPNTKTDNHWVAALEAWLAAIKEIEIANARHPADREINRLLAHGIRRVLGLSVYSFGAGDSGQLQ